MAMHSLLTKQQYEKS